jgi:hypothetical protein
MTPADSWSLLFILISGVAGLILGRYLVAEQIRFAYPAWQIGIVTFALLGANLLLGAILLYVAHPTVFDFSRILGAYARLTFLAMGVTIGYMRATLRPPVHTIKSGLKVREDGGLVLADPFVDVVP